MIFQHPTNNYRETASAPWCWALLLGGFYFLYKRCWLAALSYFALVLVLVVLGNSIFGALYPTFFYGLPVAYIFSFLANNIIRRKYGRQGWIEITEDRAGKPNEAVRFCIAFLVLSFIIGTWGFWEVDQIPMSLISQKEEVGVAIDANKVLEKPLDRVHLPIFSQYIQPEDGFLQSKIIVSVGIEDVPFTTFFPDLTVGSFIETLKHVKRNDGENFVVNGWTKEGNEYTLHLKDMIGKRPLKLKFTHLLAPRDGGRTSLLSPVRLDAEGAQKAGRDELSANEIIMDFMMAAHEDELATKTEDVPIQVDIEPETIIPNPAPPLDVEQENNSPSCTDHENNPYPCQLTNIIDPADWSYVRQAITVASSFGDSSKVNWANSTNGHGGIVSDIGASSFPACNTYQVTSKVEQDRKTATVLVCKDSSGLVSVK